MDKFIFYYVSLLIHNIALIPVVFFSFLFYLMLIFHLFLSDTKERCKLKKNFYPFISIHIPVYNDLIAIRCIKKCLELDYPKNKYEIIVIDDSDDENVKKAIDNFKDKIKILRRNTREGFKAGALNYALKYSKGDIIVIFDSDEIPPKNFLREIVKYFSDKKIAMVQARLNIYNSNQNLITKFASLLLSFYYNIILSLFYRYEAYHCAGSAVAIRKDVLLKLGGWNQKSVTEDADFSLKLVLNGYKAVYVNNLKVKAEVPFSLISFLKQQARWTFGLVRGFIENWKKIIFSDLINIKQKSLIFFQMFLNYLLGIFILIFTFSGFFVFIFGEPREATLEDLVKTFSIFFLTSGFLSNLYYIALKEKIKVKFELIFVLLTLGFILLINNSIYFLKAFFTDKFYWHVTPKSLSKPSQLFKKNKK
ncbi:MAG: glycosyltransferase [Candidatus Aenigmatarchaeota archaeon]